jgi:hypothetical protein
MLLKTLLVTHRYLGVALGLLMTIWCLSGFVMMYQGFPGVTPEERHSALHPLDMSACCALNDVEIADEATVRIRIDMIGDAPVMRLQEGREQKLINLVSGDPFGEMTEDQVRGIAQRFAAGKGVDGQVEYVRPLEIDQWTTALARRSQPLWKAQFDDSLRTTVYVAGKTGEVVQDANARERWLSWFGAIPHWLYPTILRQDGALWTQVVIWSSAVGTFLTLTGIVVGVVKLRGRSGKWFPYKRPMWLWHHVLGFFAGILVLTWVFSGLLTMSPWGLLESKPSFDSATLDGNVTWAEARPLIERVKTEAVAGDVASARVEALLGEPFVVVKHRDGAERRYDAAGEAPLSRETLEAGLKAAGGDLSLAKLDLLEREDSYYYGHKRKVDLPAWRVSLSDADATRIYIHPQTGAVLRVVGATAKRYRWMESGFHSFDWPVLRARPVWDVVVLALLAAVTAVCATGAWMSFTRVGRDAGRIRDWLSRRKG